MYGEMTSVYKILVGKPEGKRPFWRATHRWEDYFKLELRKLEFGGVDFIHLGYGLVAGFCQHGTKPLCPTKGGKFVTVWVYC
jgi:hypothetical protein